MPDVLDAPAAQSLPASPEAVRGRIEFRDVSFQYDPHAGAPVLEDIDLVAEPGQTVAILGATGSGKSTLVNLVPRFYDVRRGQILLDGVDIRQFTQDSLLAHVGIVPQETVLFSGSVRDNIRYGRPEASDEEVIAAARAAQAHDFVLQLPRGYDTHVEERGANLSGGQRQRIAIARALLTRPRVLILDDSTSSVDVETETRIQDALPNYLAGRMPALADALPAATPLRPPAHPANPLPSGRGDQQTNEPVNHPSDPFLDGHAAQPTNQPFNQPTTLLVAQRISTVLRADKIVVIDEGRIVAEGTHQQLLAGSRIYREIYDSQLGHGLPGESPFSVNSENGEAPREDGRRSAP